MAEAAESNRSLVTKCFFVGLLFGAGSLAANWKDGLPANPYALVGNLVGAGLAVLIWMGISYWLVIALRKLFGRRIRS